MPSFNEQIELDLENSKYDDETYSASPIHYIERNNITQRKDIIKVYKEWFLSGKKMQVNASAPGRVVLRHHPELIYLLKIGFIEKVRKHTGYGVKKKTINRISKNQYCLHGCNILQLKK